MAQNMPNGQQAVLANPSNLLVSSSFCSAMNFLQIEDRGNMFLILNYRFFQVSTHPLFNIGKDAVEAAKAYFSPFPIPKPPF